MRGTALCLSIALLAFSRHLAAADLSGQILEDRSGSPLASADIRIYKVGSRGLTAELESDGQGRFQAPGIPEGDYRIEVSKPNHVNSTFHRRLSAKDALVLIRLRKCGVISGRVLDREGRPVTGAHVFALTAGRGTRYGEAPGRFAQVDANGAYRLFNLPPGQYNVAVSYGASTMSVGSTGHSVTAAALGSGALFYPANARPQTFTINSGDEYPNTDFSIFTTSLHAVSGKVISTAPPEGYRRYWLALAAADSPMLATAVAQAEADGSFQFKGVPPGSYNIFAAGPSDARGSRGAELRGETSFARSTVTIGAQDIQDLTLTPDKGRPMAFVLDSAAARCSSGAQMTLSSMEDWGANLDHRTPLTAGVEKVIANVGPARYQVSVSGLGENCHVPENLVLDLSGAAPASPFKIPVIGPGAIQGRVSGNQGADFAVVLTSLSDRSEPQQIATPDDESRFAFSSLKPGKYRLALRSTRSSWTDEKGPSAEVDVPSGVAVEVTLNAERR